MASIAEGNQRKKVSASFQGITFLAAFACLSLIFAIQHKQFYTDDPPAPLTTQNQSKDGIITGLHVTHFTDFDVSKNRFVMDGIVWFLFDPHTVSLETIKKFTISNGSLQKVSKPIISDHNSKKLVQFRIQATFHSSLNYRMFPFDDHHIHCIISNQFLPKNMIFTSNTDDITVDNSLFLEGWKINSVGVKSGTRKVDLYRGQTSFADQFKEVAFTFNCERTDPSIIINILLSLLLILFISLLTFSSHEDSVLIVSVAIVALIGYRSVMQSMSPAQVSYFMYADYLYVFALIGVIITLFADIITREHNSSLLVKKGVIIGIYSFFVLACLIMYLIS